MTRRKNRRSRSKGVDCRQSKRLGRTAVCGRSLLHANGMDCRKLTRLRSAARDPQGTFSFLDNGHSNRSLNHPFQLQVVTFATTESTTEKQQRFDFPALRDDTCILYIARYPSVPWRRCSFLRPSGVRATVGELRTGVPSPPHPDQYRND